MCRTGAGDKAQRRHGPSATDAVFVCLSNVSTSPCGATGSHLRKVHGGWLVVEIVGIRTTSGCG